AMVRGMDDGRENGVVSRILASLLLSDTRSTRLTVNLGLREG
ncbi:hypothetical protein LCGC14_2160310, partial [marine sediment metagenome]